MFNSLINSDGLILLLLVNYLILILLNRYLKYRQYRFYPENLNFLIYLKQKFFSLNVLFYSIGLLFLQLFFFKFIYPMV